MQIKAVPIDGAYHLEGYVAHFGHELTDPSITLVIAGKTRTVALGNGGYVDIDETVAMEDLLANPKTEARSSHTGYRSHAGPRPPSDYVQTGVFEPAASHPDVLLHKGLSTFGFRKDGLTPGHRGRRFSRTDRDNGSGRVFDSRRRHDRFFAV
jgi:hypothetical protein